MQIEKYHAKTVIRTSTPSLFSWAEVYLNPYQGCYHNCVYCNGKAEYYHMHEDFGTRIKIKVNTPDLLKKYLQKKGFFSVHKKVQLTIHEFFPEVFEEENNYHKPKFIITIGGGVCDTYQPAEKEIKISRKILEILYDYKFPVWILTKSNLVLRDIDLLKKINEETNANVNFTITLADDNQQKIFKPHASSSSERFEAIRQLRTEGIHCGIYLLPMMPLFADKQENLQKIYSQAKEVDAEFIFTGGLTLKPGRNKNEFMAILQKHYPKIYLEYQLLYGNNNKYGNIDKEKFTQKGLIWPVYWGFKYAYESNIDYAAKRYCPPGRFESNVTLYENFYRIMYLKQLLNETRHEINQFKKAAAFIEDSRRNFDLLTEKDYEKLPLTKTAKNIIINYVETKTCPYLETLENNVYHFICNKYFS